MAQSCLFKKHTKGFKKIVGLNTILTDITLAIKSNQCNTIENTPMVIKNLNKLCRYWY